MLTHTLSDPKYRQLISTNPIVKQLVNEIEDEHTLTMRKLAHEINNALTLINSSIQVITSSHPEVSGYKYWDFVQDDIHHLISLMKDITTYNNGKTLLSPAPTDLTEMLLSIINSFDVSPTRTKLTLHPETDIPIILSDRTKLRQVFINIIKNALEAVADIPQAYVKIILSYDPDAETIFIRFKDNGCGIPPEQIDVIFSPMVTFKPNGNGLGLSISKKIIEAHNGSISVTSRVGQGTCFTICLPV